MRVFVTYGLPGSALAALGREVELVGNLTSRLCERGSLLEGLPGCDGLLCTISDAIDAEVIAAGDALRVLSNYGAGTDHIDLVAAASRNLPVGHTPGVLTESTADFTWALLLAVARRVVEGDGVMRREEFPGWMPDYHLGRDITGSTLGIVGLGSIGRAVAHRARAFSMRVLYHGRRRAPREVEAELGVEPRTLEALLTESDFVSLHCPLTPETRHLIDADALALMKPGAILINTSRGAVVDEAALAAAVGRGHLAGAALDVFEEEPRAHSDLLEMPQVVLAPHLGSATLATRSRMSDLAVANLRAGLAGEPLPHRVVS